MAQVVKEIVISVTDKGQLKVATKEVDKLNQALNRTKKAQGDVGKSSQTLDRNLKGNSQMSANASKNFSKQAQGMQGVLVPAYAEVAARVFALTAAYTALERAADYNILLQGQQSYAQQTGKNLGLLAKRIQEASGHMLDFAEASSSAALASTAGLSSKSIDRMTKSARAASVALGRNMSDSMDRLTRGIVKAEPEILDEIGVIIRLDNVYKDYAASLGKTTTELTEFEKLTARTNAILGQTESKFGDIADSVPANSFKQLSASVLDIVRTAGSFASQFLTPFTTFLSESPALIGILMAIITKNLIGQVFPALQQFGQKFSNLPKSMGKSIEAMQQKADSLSKRRLALMKEIGKPGAFERELRNTLNQLNIKPGSKIQQTLAKNLTGKAFRDEIARSISSAVGRAKAKAGRGEEAGGIFQGLNPAIVNKLDTAFRNFDNSLKNSNKSLRGLVGIEFLSWVNMATQGITAVGIGALRAAASWFEFGRSLYGVTSNQGIIAGFKTLKDYVKDTMYVGTMGQKGVPLLRTIKQADTLTKKLGASMAVLNLAGKTAFGGMVVGLTKVVQSLNMVGFIFGTFQFIKWMAEEFLSWGKNLSKSTEALSQFQDSLDQIGDSITKTKIEFDPMHIAGSFNEAIKSAEFISNISEQFSDSINTALSKINLEKDSGLGGFLSNFMDSVYDFFGSGLHDELGDSLAKALSVQLKKGIAVGTDTLKSITDLTGDFSNSEKIFKKLAGGISLTADEVERLSEAFEDTDNAKAMVDIMKDLGKTATSTAQKTQEVAASLKELRETSVKYESDRKKFVRDLVADTAFTDLANDFQNLVNLYNKSEVSFSQKLLSLKEAGVLEDTGFGSLDEYSRKLDKISELETKVRNLRAEGNVERADNLDRYTQSIKNTIPQVEKLIEAEIGREGIVDILKSLYSLDPREANRKALALANETARLEREVTELSKLGSSVLEERVEREAKVLELQREQLQLKLALAKPGDLKLGERENIVGQIEEFSRKIDKVRRTYEEMARRAVEISGETLLTSDLLAAMRKDFTLGDSIFDKKALQEITIEFNKLVNSLDEAFGDAQNVKFTADVLAMAADKGLVSAKAAKTMLRDYKLLYTTEGKALKTRREAIVEDLYRIEVEKAHWNEYEDIMDLRQEMAKLDLEVSEKTLQLEKERNKLVAARALMAQKETDLEFAKREENLTYIKGFIDQVSDSFRDSIKDVFEDLFMNREVSGTDFRTAIAEGLAGAASSTIANFAQAQVFGNQGFLAEFARGQGMKEDTIKYLFPQTEVEAITGELTTLQDIERAILERMDKLNTISQEIKLNTGSTAANTSSGTPGVSNLSTLQDRYKTLSQQGYRVSKNPTAIDAAWNLYQKDLAQVKKSSEQTANILKQEQGPNSFSVYDEQANKKLNALKDKIVKDVNERHNFRQDVKHFQDPENKFKIKKVHKGLDYNRQLPGFQHPESVRQAAHKADLLKFKAHGNQMFGAQKSLPFTGPGIPQQTAPSLLHRLTPAIEKLSAWLTAIMPNTNIMDEQTELQMLEQFKGAEGALKVQEINPELQKEGTGTTPGVPLTVVNPTSDAVAQGVSNDLRGAMASNLHSQIMNDNLNARAMITNSVSQVGSNLMSSAIGSLFGFANGGVIKGGFRAFANGGTVTDPTLGLIGEGKYNEAVVPLPDGKSIPVIGNTGGTNENNVTVNVSLNSDGSAKTETQSNVTGDDAKQLGYLVSQAVQQELVEQQRPGGLLSKY